MATQVKLGSAGMRAANMPETFMLWLLIAFELAFMTSLRYYFRRNHGG